jgi:predicted dehydrogenase
MKLGIIGTGYMGRTHYTAAGQVSGVEVVAVADARGTTFLEGEFPNVRAYTDGLDLIRDEEVDAVIIAVPTFLHETFAVEAARHGKHILCEKPFALTVAAAERMLEAANAGNVSLMIAQPLRFWPAYVALRRAVLEGRIGRPRFVHGWRLATMPDWGAWFQDPSKSGGCLLDLHIHDLDFAYHLLGQPRSVYTAGVLDTNGASSHVDTTLQYPDCVATLEASYDLPPSWPFSMGLRVSGESGCVEYSFAVSGNVEEREAASTRLMHYPRKGRAVEIDFETGDAYVEQLRYFVGTVARGAGLSVCPPDESLAVMKVYEACVASLESGATVDLGDSAMERR